MSLKDDWKHLENLARELCSINEKTKKNKERKNLLRYLRRLEIKYRDNINIIATHADFMLNKKTALKLYLRAYELAIENQDFQNCTYISSSIAEIYLYYRDDVVNGEHWINQLENNLSIFFDKDSKNELDDYKEMLKLLRTSECITLSSLGKQPGVRPECR